MTSLIFPSLPGEEWPSTKTPTQSTLTRKGVGGREVRSANYAQALYEFELSYSGLDAQGMRFNLQNYSLQTLMGFFAQMKGQAENFIYIDADDSAATNQSIGAGDGVSTQFTVGRSIGSFYEPVSYITTVAGVSVAGVATTAYAIIPPNILLLASPPANGAAIVMTFNFGFICRFIEDICTFENFMKSLWTNRSVKFRQVRGPTTPMQSFSTTVNLVIPPNTNVGVDANPMPSTIASFPQYAARVAATPTVVAGAYAAMACIGGVITLPNALPAGTLSAILQDLTLKFAASVQTGNFFVSLFTAAPAGTFADGVVPVIAAADTALLIGTYWLRAPLSVLGTHTIARVGPILRPTKGVSTSLFAVVQCQSATAALASTADMTLVLGMALP